MLCLLWFNVGARSYLFLHFERCVYYYCYYYLLFGVGDGVDVTSLLWLFEVECLDWRCCCVKDGDEHSPKRSSN